jgi:TldD protein
MRKIVDEALKLGATFSDIRVERYKETYFELQDGNLRNVSIGNEEGAAVRVLFKGTWGFSSTSKLTTQDLMNAVKEALVAARSLSYLNKEMKDVYLLPDVVDDVPSETLLNPKDVPFETKVQDLSKLHLEIVKNRDYVKTVTLRYADTIGETLYVSSDGRDIRQEFVVTWAYAWVTGREGDVSASVREEIGSIKGYDLWDRWPQNELANKLTLRLHRQLHAKTPKGGAYPAVLAPEVVGVFVHEAFGHLSEADLTLSGSAVRDKLGKKIASDLVTVVDDPEIKGGFGSFKYDDEGVDTRRVYLIKDGVVKELMVDREYAARLGIKPTGNARAESYRVPPLIRMRNTILLPRDFTFDELIEDIEYGYYLVAVRGGQANLDGVFQVGIQEAYEIINGEIGSPVRNMSISGNTLETLALIDAVGKDLKLEYGRCGKGQLVYVTDGGPHVRVRKLVVGGAR